MKSFEFVVRLVFRGLFAIGGTILVAISSILLQFQPDEISGNIARVVMTLAFWSFGAALIALSCFPDRQLAFTSCAVASISLGFTSSSWISGLILPALVIFALVNGFLAISIRLSIEWFGRLNGLKQRFTNIVWGARNHWR